MPVLDLVIRAVDPHDDSDMESFQSVYAAAEHAEDPDAPLYSREDAVAMLSTTDGAVFCEGYGAFLDGRMTGELLLTGSLRDNLKVARVWIWVTPSSQRRGVGTRLSEHAEGRMRSLDRSIAQAQARIGADCGGNRRFAERLGYALANTEIERRLALPADPDALATLAAEAAPHHADYDIRAVVGPVPHDLAPSYVALKNLLNVEMPSGELDVETGAGTPDDLAIVERKLLESGRTRVGAYAVAPDGTVVAYTDAGVTSDQFDHVDQWGTIVDPRHRGHRLGMAVKCALLRAIGERFPQKRFISTTNAETNLHMVAINEALGFEITQVYGEFQKRLEATD